MSLLGCLVLAEGAVALLMTGPHPRTHGRANFRAWGGRHTVLLLLLLREEGGSTERTIAFVLFVVGGICRVGSDGTSNQPG